MEDGTHCRRGLVATTGGVDSPTALFLREKRTWLGLTSDFCPGHQQAESAGLQRGALVEEGRSGLARGMWLAPMALCSDSCGISRGIGVPSTEGGVCPPDRVLLFVLYLFTIPLHAARSAIAVACRCPRGQQRSFFRL